MLSRSRTAAVLAAACLLTVLVRPVPAQVIRSGPPTCRGVALTFDLCPVREGSGYDEGLVQMLIQRHIPATFFLSGRWAARHEEQTRALLRIPYFEFGTHGQRHDHLPLLDAAGQRHEVEHAVTLLQDRYGRTSTLFRPPYGEFDDTTVQVVRDLGLRFILWNLVSGDPDPHLAADQILTRVSSGVHNGSIIVFHANGKGRHTREVVERLYDQVLRTGGLRPVTVSELLAGCGDGTALR